MLLTFSVMVLKRQGQDGVNLGLLMSLAECHFAQAQLAQNLELKLGLAHFELYDFEINLGLEVFNKISRQGFSRSSQTRPNLIRGQPIQLSGEILRPELSPQAKISVLFPLHLHCLRFVSNMQAKAQSIYNQTKELGNSHGQNSRAQVQKNVGRAQAKLGLVYELNVSVNLYLNSI